ncbi:hypothetical protein [Metabacillus niabensis]|uniref:Uncharacterized protein n=1 Tax=Metabacillus niabensis TaxID=324854 RepID=A0ABT9Z674_9BACI|nr:hypothetical protein [Metabacillus niabensis]MDQ0227346.1 hypothetical protein [Metabacillus niabensis]
MKKKLLNIIILGFILSVSSYYCNAYELPNNLLKEELIKQLQGQIPEVVGLNYG